MIYPVALQPISGICCLIVEFLHHNNRHTHTHTHSIGDTKLDTIYSTHIFTRTYTHFNTRKKIRAHKIRQNNRAHTIRHKQFDTHN